jgi:hypothetical protein
MPDPGPADQAGTQRMIEPEGQEAKASAARERFHDRVISLLLSAIWILAAYFVWRSDADIPVSMLLIATAFFILLVPAMKELAKIVDRWLRSELGLGDRSDDR